MKAEIELLASFQYDRACSWEGDALVPSAWRETRVMQVFGEHNALFVLLSDVRQSDTGEILQWAQRWGVAADTLPQWQHLIQWTRQMVQAWKHGKPIPAALLDLSNMPAKVSIVPVARGHKAQIVLQSLADLLFAQCIFAISRRAKLRGCQVCGQPFLEFPPFTRATRIYCSRKCNQVAYRERQESKHVTSKKRKPSTKGTRGRRSPKDK